MEKEFVPYEFAVKLKVLGFDEPCFGWWFADEEMFIMEKSKKSTSENIIQAPTYSQAFKWFREKGYNSGVIPYGNHFYFRITNYCSDFNYRSDDLMRLRHEEAELACLRKLIEIVESKSE